MKYKWITILLVISIGCFLIIRGSIDTDELYYDDDQEGLNDQIVIRFSHVVAENTPKGLAAQKFAEILYAKSNGRVRVEVFPNGSLFSDDDELAALVDNDIQMIAPSFSKMTDLAPEWGLFDLPFLFNSLEDVDEAFTGEIGEYLLNTLSDKGIKGLSLWGNGFKQMTSYHHSFIVPEDFTNQRIRIMPSAILKDQFELLHAKPIVIPFNEVYDSLASAVIDGQENTLSNIYSRRWYELQRYMTVSNHGYLGYAVIMNGDFWNSLSKDVQAMLNEAMHETTKWNLQESKRVSTELLDRFENEVDIEIHYLSDAEKKSWEVSFQPLYEQFWQEASTELIERLAGRQTPAGY